MDDVIHTLVLGTRDPEMDAIGRVALAEQMNVIWAQRDGHPVRYDEMYGVDTPRPQPGMLWVECSPTEGKSGIDFVDHHQPGDPGFGKPPKEFWASSSLGQVWNRLCPDKKPPEALLTIAAADHCPHAAYSGGCPNVDPGTVVAFSAEQIAMTTGQSFKSVIQSIYQCIHKFKTLPTETMHGGLVYFRRKGPPLKSNEWLILREAGLWHGIAIIASVAGGNEAWYRLAGHANEDLVNAFVAGTIIEGLTHRYGDPHRGYAGGRREN